MIDPRSFIARWSRRKRAAATPSPVVGEGGGADSNVGLPVSGPPPPTPPHRKSGLPDLRTLMPNPGKPGFGGEGSTPSAKQDCDPNESETAARAGPATSEISFDVTKLPAIESITAETDIRAFLAPEVPPELTRAALRRAWAADPKIREFIGLSENAWDFNAPDAMAGFGPLEMTDELRRQITAMVGRNLAGETPDKDPPASVEPLGTQVKPATAPQSAAMFPALPAPPAQRMSGTAQAPVESNMSDRADPVPHGNVDHRARQHDAAKPDCAQPVAKRRHGRALPE
jgi:hypothetical protein